MKKANNPIVAEIGKLHFEGNIIPHEWYGHIKLESGKTNLPAITILAEIVYWYRPIRELDETTGKPKSPRQKFTGDMFESGAAYYENKFGLTKDQARKALKRLEDTGYIRREYRDVVRNGVRYNNVMFVEPNPQKVAKITGYGNQIASKPSKKTPLPEEVTLSPPSDTLSPPGDTLSPPGDTLSPPGDTLSPPSDTLSPPGDTFKINKISTKITKNTQTNTGSEKNENSCNESVFFPLNDFEKAAWDWAQAHDFWKNRITTVERLRKNLETGKDFRRQFDKANTPVQPSSHFSKPSSTTGNGRMVFTTNECPFCDENGELRYRDQNGEVRKILCKHWYDTPEVGEKRGFEFIPPPNFKAPISPVPREQGLVKLGTLINRLMVNDDDVPF